MNITNKINQTVFQSKNIIAKLTKEIPNTKVAKNLTNLDIINFQIYINARPYRMGITTDEIKKLNKLEGEEFISKSYKMLREKLRIPDEIRPPVHLVNQIDGEAVMAYNATNNMIIGDLSKINNLSKTKIFAGLRHELQHFNQNLSILRHETLGKDAIDTMTKTYVANEKNVVKAYIDAYSDKELNEIFQHAPSVLETIMKTKKYSKEGNTRAIDELFNQIGEAYKPSLLEFQNKVIKNMGQIKEESSLTPKIKNYFNEFYNNNYTRENGTIKYKEYYNQIAEQEAVSSECAATLDLNPQTCPMKYIKEEAYKALTNQTMMDRLNKEFS